MANLIIEIGNTALKAALCEERTIGKTLRYQGEKRIDFICSVIREEMPDFVTIASVTDITAQEEKKIRKECEKLLILDSQHSAIMEKYGFPAYLTYDRVASLVAAKSMFRGRGCTVFDFGTTLTIDFLSETGEYEGGNISIGCRTRFKAVNRYSRALPLLETPETVKETGTTRQESIESGIIQGIMFEIQGYMDSKPDNVNIFTGGDANYFVKKKKNTIFVICNLVIMGLAIITDEYVKESLQ